MKHFIGIGSDHHKDVFDRVQAILDRCKPDAITVEKEMHASSTFFVDPETFESRKARLLDGSARYQVISSGRDIQVRVLDFYLVGHSRDTKKTENKASIDYALEHGIPLYLADWAGLALSQTWCFV